MYIGREPAGLWPQIEHPKLAGCPNHLSILRQNLFREIQRTDLAKFGTIRKIKIEQKFRWFLNFDFLPLRGEPREKREKKGECDFLIKIVLKDQIIFTAQSPQ